MIKVKMRVSPLHDFYSVISDVPLLLFQKMRMWMDLEEKGVPAEELPALAKQSMVLPDYKNNPRVTTRDEMLDLLQKCYTRQDSR